MASKLSAKLCFAWSGALELLKQFIKNVLNLEGTWSQPNGQTKLFINLHDSTILWKKIKNVLCLDGDRAESANEIKQRLCKAMCFFEAPILGARLSSVNLEAIQALPETIIHIYIICDVPISELYMDSHNVDKTLITARKEFQYDNQDNNWKGSNK